MSKITLREISRQDIGTLNSWRADRESVALLGSPFRHVSPEVDERWFNQYLESRNNNLRLAICRANGRMVGVVYLLGIDWISRSAEFAIWLGESSARGKGIGEKASRELLAHAFGDLNLERVFLTVLPSNKRAIALYRKIGFVEEGVMRRAVFKDGEYRGLLVMSLLRDEFSARPSK